MPAPGGPYREREARPARRLGRYALLEQRDDGMIGARWIAALETARASGATPPALHVVEIAPAIAERARTARALGRLREVVDVSDAALEAVHEIDLDAALIASALVAGERLSRVAADEPRTPALAGAALAGHVVAEAARGAGALHRAGLAHGAITPRRVLVLAYDGAVTLVGAVEAALLPFAPAHAQHEARGEIAYRAPEILGGARASPMSDVLSLGILVWELVARAPLFPTRDRARHARGRCRARAAALPASCPRAVARVVEAALARDPKARFRDADDLANALRAAAGVDARTGQRALAAHMTSWFSRPRAELDARLAARGRAPPG